MLLGNQKEKWKKLIEGGRIWDIEQKDNSLQKKIKNLEEEINSHQCWAAGPVISRWITD